MMEQLPEDNPLPSDNSVEKVETPSLGRMLREARENLGLSVRDVAGQIKFAPRQIEALEADDFVNLPEMAFVRGFVRSYAKILKLDAQKLLSTLTLTQSVEATGELTPASVNVPFPDKNVMHRQNLIWLGLALLSAVLVVVIAVKNYTDAPVGNKVTLVETQVALPAEIQSSSTTESLSSGAEASAKPVKMEERLPVTHVQPLKREATTSASQPPQTQSDGQTAVLAEPTPSGTLRIEFESESWVEIKDRDGNILLSQMYQPGSDLQLQGNAPLSVLVGHAQSVRVFYRDKQIDLAPYTRSSTDVAYLKLK